MEAIRERLTKKEVVKETQGDTKKIGNNTFKVKYADREAIRYHHTDIIVIYPDGKIILNTNGWLTSTTKERMGYLNNYGYSIQQVNKVWYLISRSTRQEWPYKDGMTIYPDGRVEGEGDDPKKLLKLDKQITKYIDGFIKALFNKEIGKPEPGDCWGCYMRDVKTGETIMGKDHFLSHFEEKYYVPSLLVNAINAFPVSIIASSTIGWYMRMNNQDCSMFQRITGIQLKSSLRQYLRRQLGMAA
jgi:hypothetical protein